MEEQEKPTLNSITYAFTQEGNCVDGRDTEELIIEAKSSLGKSSLGIGYDEGVFYVLKTNRWSIDNIDDLKYILDKIEENIKTFTE